MLSRSEIFALAILLLAAVPMVLGTFSSPANPAKRRTINLPNRSVQAPFSDGVLVGNTLYLAGRLGLDPKTGKVPEDLEQEIRLLLDGIKATLGEAGINIDYLLLLQEVCPSLSLHDQFNCGYIRYFNKESSSPGFLSLRP